MGTTPDAYIVRLGASSTSMTDVQVRPGAAMNTPLPWYASRRLAPLVSPSQAYYWTRAWQAAEQESLAAREAGESKVFESAEDAIRYLLSEDDE